VQPRGGNKTYRGDGGQRSNLLAELKEMREGGREKGREGLSEAVSKSEETENKRGKKTDLLKSLPKEGK